MKPVLRSNQACCQAGPCAPQLSSPLDTMRAVLHRRRTAALRRTGGFGLRPYLLPRLLQLRVQRHRPIWRLHNLRCPSKEAQARQRQRSISMRLQDGRKKLRRAGWWHLRVFCLLLPARDWEEHSNSVGFGQIGSQLGDDADPRNSQLR